VKVECGSLKIGDSVLALPLGERLVCKSIYVRGIPAKLCQAGDYVSELELQSGEVPVSGPGSVLCNPSIPLPVVTEFHCKVVVFDIDMPVVLGMQLMVYVHAAKEGAMILQMNRYDTKTARLTPLRELSAGIMAIIELRTFQHICIRYSSEKSKASPLSRVILRLKGKTIAAGLIIHKRV